MTQTLDFEREFAERGYSAVKTGGGRSLVWRRVFDEVVNWDVYLTPSSTEAILFGCSVVVNYHPSARDTWGDKEPFRVAIREHDLTQNGLEDLGTPGASTWNYTNPSSFFLAFDLATSLLAECCASRTSILAEALRQLRRSPKNSSLLMAAAFLQLELGDVTEAKKSFGAYLERVPALRPIMGPRIQELFLEHD